MVLAKFDKNDDFFSKKQFNEEPKAITLEELIHNEGYKMTLVRGVGGAGKTFMMKTIAIQWARNKLWRNIKYLFFLTFRELNLYNVSTLKELLELKYAEVFNKVKFSKLFDLDILFLLDGVDEFAKLDDFKTIANGISTNSISNTAKAIYQVINPNSGILPNRKVIITGRPDACSQLLWIFDIMRIKEVDVLGFSPAKVKEYINIFSANNTNLRDIIHLKIEGSGQLKSMARLPAYLWTICSLYQEDISIETPKTSTELLMWQLTMFLHKHYRISKDTISIFKLFRVPKIKALVFSLANVARTMLIRKDILIDVETFPSSVINANIEKSGLVSKIATLVDKEKYQFNHLLMQEFLSAIYYVKEAGYDTMKELRLMQRQSKRVMFMYLGLQGALLNESTSTGALKRFVLDLELCLTKESLLDLTKQFIGTLSDTNDLMEAMHEYHNYIEGQITYRDKELSRLSGFWIHEIPVDVEHVIFFLLKYSKNFNLVGLVFHFNKLTISVRNIERLMAVICKNVAHLIITAINMEGDLSFLVGFLYKHVQQCSTNIKTLSIFWSKIRRYSYKTNKKIFSIIKRFENVRIFILDEISDTGILRQFHKLIVGPNKECKNVAIKHFKLLVDNITRCSCNIIAELTVCINIVEIESRETHSHKDIECVKTATNDLIRSKRYVLTKYFRIKEWSFSVIKGRYIQGYWVKNNKPTCSLHQLDYYLML